MKYAMLILPLVLLSAWPVYADWIQVDEAPSIGMTVYIDPLTVRHKGDSVTLWYLFDYKKNLNKEGDSILSDKYHGEFDCREKRSRNLAFMVFTSNMGRGAPLDSIPTKGEWHPVVPESIGHTFWQFACGKQ